MYKKTKCTYSFPFQHDDETAFISILLFTEEIIGYNKKDELFVSQCHHSIPYSLENKEDNQHAFMFTRFRKNNSVKNSLSICIM